MADDDLAALLAEHSYFSYVENQDGTSGSECECGVLLCPGVEYAPPALAGHQAEVIAAAGWRKGREEWGVRFERDAGPTMDNPSGEVTNTNVMRDEWNARNAVERNVPISARNRRVVRRYVTDWEEQP